METPPPSYPHQDMMRAVSAQLDMVEERLATLVMHDPAGGLDIIAPLRSQWQDLPGRAGVQVYHVPHPGHPGELFVTVSLSAPGSAYTGSRIDESRLIGVLNGEINFDGVPLAAGEFAWIGPNQPTSWATTGGAVCAVHYHAPKPDSLTI